VASHTGSLILRSTGARHTLWQPVNSRCWHCLSRILLFSSDLETSTRNFNLRYTKLSLSNLLSICLVGSSITLAPDIKARKKTPNNHNLHHPPDIQAHEIILLANTFHIYICPYHIFLSPPLTSTTLNTHLWGVHHTSATTWTVGRPKGLHGRKGP